MAYEDPFSFIKDSIQLELNETENSLKGGINEIIDLLDSSEKDTEEIEVSDARSTACQGFSSNQPGFDCPPAQRTTSNLSDSCNENSPFGLSYENYQQNFSQKNWEGNKNYMLLGQSDKTVYEENPSFHNKNIGGFDVNQNDSISVNNNYTRKKYYEQVYPNPSCQYVSKIAPESTSCRYASYISTQNQDNSSQRFGNGSNYSNPKMSLPENPVPHTNQSSAASNQLLPIFNESLPPPKYSNSYSNQFFPKPHNQFNDSFLSTNKSSTFLSHPPPAINFPPPPTVNFPHPPTVNFPPAPTVNYPPPPTVNFPHPSNSFAPESNTPFLNLKPMQMANSSGQTYLYPNHSSSYNNQLISKSSLTFPQTPNPQAYNFQSNQHLPEYNQFYPQTNPQIVHPFSQNEIHSSQHSSQNYPSDSEISQLIPHINQSLPQLNQLPQNDMAFSTNNQPLPTSNQFLPQNIHPTPQTNPQSVIGSQRHFVSPEVNNPPNYKDVSSRIFERNTLKQRITEPPTPTFHAPSPMPISHPPPPQAQLDSSSFFVRDKDDFLKPKLPPSIQRGIKPRGRPPRQARHDPYSHLSPLPKQKNSRLANHSHSSYNLNVPRFQREETPFPEPPQRFHREGTPFPQTSKRFQREGTPFPEPPKRFQREGTPFPEPPKRFQREGTPFPETTQRFQRERTPYPETLQRFQREGTPFPETKRFQGEVTPTPLKKGNSKRLYEMSCRQYHHGNSSNRNSYLREETHRFELPRRNSKYQNREEREATPFRFPDQRHRHSNYECPSREERGTSPAKVFNSNPSEPPTYSSTISKRREEAESKLSEVPSDPTLSGFSDGRKRAYNLLEEELKKCPMADCPEVRCKTLSSYKRHVHLCHVWHESVCYNCQHIISVTQHANSCSAIDCKEEICNSPHIPQLTIDNLHDHQQTLPNIKKENMDNYDLDWEEILKIIC